MSIPLERAAMQADEKGQGYVLTLLDVPDQGMKAEAEAALTDTTSKRLGSLTALRLEPACPIPRQGGFWGRTELGLLFLDMFFLPETVRGRSQGGRLLLAVEAEARRRGCKRAVVETSSFQAPGFYKRHGYEEFGRIEFGLPDHSRVLLRKSLE